MRLLFTISDRANWTGGPIVNFRRLLPALQSAGHEIFVLAGYRGDYPNIRYLQEKGIHCRLTTLPASTESLIRWTIAQVNDLHPDVFIGDTEVFGGFSGHWVKAAGIPVIMIHRSHDAYNWGIAATFVYGPPDWQVSGLVCVSEFLKKSTIAKLGHDNFPVAVIPSGVPPSNFHANEPEPNDILKLVYSGRLEQKQKRILTLISCFLEASETMPNLQLTLIGNGSYNNKIEQIKNEHKNGYKIIIKSPLYSESYHKELSDHHCIILFSAYEGTPGSLMDGMSCGLIPITTFFPGVEELVKTGENGFIIQPNTQGLIQALHEVATGRKWQTLSQKAIETIVQSFSLPSAVNRWQAFLSKLSGKPSEKKLPIQLPEKLDLPPVQYPLCRSDRREDWSNTVRRNIFILSQEIRARYPYFSSNINT